jgi:hypothetical protein
MTEPSLTPDTKPRFSLDRSPRTTEGRFFGLFIALAVLSWSIGFTSFQLNELKIKREIAAAQKAEEEAKAERLKALNIDFTSSKYGGYTALPGGKFKYKFETNKNCKSSRPCATPTILSKFGCESVKLNFRFTKASGDIVSEVSLTEEYVSSLDPFTLYFESTNNKSVDYVEFVTATCNGESY